MKKKKKKKKKKNSSKNVIFIRTPVFKNAKLLLIFLQAKSKY